MQEKVEDVIRVMIGWTQNMNKHKDKETEQLEIVRTKRGSLESGCQAATADYTFTYRLKQEDVRLRTL